MKQLKTGGGEAQSNEQTCSIGAAAGGLDAQYAELIESVFACERNWTLDSRVAAAVKYGR